MKSLAILPLAFGFCGSLALADGARFQEPMHAIRKIPVMAQLGPADSYGYLWASDAGDFLGSQLMTNARRLCESQGLKYKALESVKITILAHGSSEIQTEKNKWSGPKLFLKFPTGSAEAVAVCEYSL